MGVAQHSELWPRRTMPPAERRRRSESGYANRSDSGTATNDRTIANRASTMAQNMNGLRVRIDGSSSGSRW